MNQDNTMSRNNRILFGALGAVTPIALNLIAFDYNTLANLTVWIFVGYAIRVTALMFLGGVVSMLHKDEQSPVKLFELGIVAPALIGGLLHGGHGVNGGSPISAGLGQILFVRPVYAASQAAGLQQRPVARKFSMPEESRTEQVWRGLTGKGSEKTWFVIVGSHLKIEDAERQIDRINHKYPEFKAELYEPYGGNPYYPVVIGANLTYKDAQQLRRRAVGAGLPKDTFLWTLPTE